VDRFGNPDCGLRDPATVGCHSAWTQLPFSMDAPKSLGSAEEREARIAMLNAPHVAPLTQFVMDLRRKWVMTIAFRTLTHSTCRRARKTANPRTSFRGRHPTRCAWGSVSWLNTRPQRQSWQDERLKVNAGFWALLAASASTATTSTAYFRTWSSASILFLMGQLARSGRSGRHDVATTEHS